MWAALAACGADWAVTARAQDIVAHRGASYDAPENTLAAFQLAWQQGADGIEGDFHLTRDRQIVCFHDATAKRLTGIDRAISQMTLAEVRALDVGRWKGPQWAGARVPTLDEVLATVPADKYALIEIKCGPEIIPALTEQLAAARLRPDQTRVIAFDASVIAEVKRRLPKIKTHWLVGYRQDEQTGAWSPTRQEILATLIETGADGVSTSGNRQVVDAALAEAIRARGLEFHVWTIDDVADARYFQRLGADSLTTNRPSFLRNGLAR
ncbi:MAG: hypothetical protein A2W31_17195 [Planctomycetes bacterium RBG_16_64_10]|nr:MAG: hypothetical protein A2W31_17195 [Planctomycetes bacterium RBG_16_64_10]